MKERSKILLAVATYNKILFGRQEGDHGKGEICNYRFVPKLDKNRHCVQCEMREICRKMLRGYKSKESHIGTDTEWEKE